MASKCPEGIGRLQASGAQAFQLAEGERHTRFMPDFAYFLIIKGLSLYQDYNS
jgi:hypothetical protein